MKTKNLVRLGRITALISFVLGTAVFSVYYMTSSSKFLFVAYAFIVFAALVNIPVFIIISTKEVRKDESNDKNLKQTRIWMLANIPIMLLYCWFSMVLLSTMRITFINSTQTTLTDINIIGCGGGHIKKLEIGESRTIWVDITGDCSIKIDYLQNGQRKSETVAGYITANMGQKARHKIDGKDKEIII